MKQKIDIEKLFRDALVYGRGILRETLTEITGPREFAQFIHSKLHPNYCMGAWRARWYKIRMGFTLPWRVYFFFRFKFPLVTRNAYNKALLEERKRGDDYKRRCDKKLEEDKARWSKDIHQVLQNLMQIAVVYQSEPERMGRVVIDFDPYFMARAFERGNDRNMIEHISDHVKWKVVDELMSANIQRPEDVGLGRRWI